MSTTIVAVIIMLLTHALPLIGIHIGSEALQTTVQTVVDVVAGLWIWYRRVAKGDVTVLGKIK